MQWQPSSFLDVIQTMALIVMSGILIYAVLMVRRLIQAGLLTVIRDNERLSKQVAALGKRLEALEDRTCG